MSEWERHDTKEGMTSSIASTQVEAEAEAEAEAGGGGGAKAEDGEIIELFQRIM